MASPSQLACLCCADLRLGQYFKLNFLKVVDCDYSNQFDNKYRNDTENVASTQHNRRVTT